MRRDWAYARRATHAAHPRFLARRTPPFVLPASGSDLQDLVALRGPAALVEMSPAVASAVLRARPVHLRYAERLRQRRAHLERRHRSLALAVGTTHFRAPAPARVRAAPAGSRAKASASSPPATLASFPPSSRRQACVTRKVILTGSACAAPGNLDYRLYSRPGGHRSIAADDQTCKRRPNKMSGVYPSHAELSSSSMKT